MAIEKKDKTESMLLNVQFGIFFSNPIARPDLLARMVADNYSQYFDLPPTNLPIPADIIDFPSTQVTSSNGYWQVNISRKRADVIFKPEENQTYNTIESEIDNIIEILIKLANEARSQKVEIARLTSIGNFIILNQNPVAFLQENFLKASNTNRKEVQIRFNDPINENNFLCNNIIQYVNGEAVMTKNGVERPAILITRDFNTDPKDRRSFTDDDINGFKELAQKYAFNPGIS